MRRLLLAATILAVLTACSASEDEPAVFQTLPEAVPATSDDTVDPSPDPPTDDSAGSSEPSDAVPSALPSAAASTTDTGSPPEPESTGASGSTAPTAPADIARELGLDGLIDLIGQDPEAAGDRGEDLLEELERVRDRPDRRRIDRALDRLQAWDEDGDIHPEVADAARVVLTELDADADADNGNGNGQDDSDRNDEDDDDDD